MSDTNAAIEFFDELSKIHSSENSIEIKYTRLRMLLEQVTKHLTRNEPLQFSNLFARLSFVCEKYTLPRNIHGLRISANKVLHEGYSPSQNEYETHLKYLSEFISRVFKIAIPWGLKAVQPKVLYQAPRIINRSSRLKKLRVEIARIHSNHLLCYSEQGVTDEYITVKFNHLEDYDCIRKFWKGAQLYLVNIEVDEDEVYYPKIIILEPDYLIDISTIAECFQDYGRTELFYIKSKFDEIPNSRHIRLGNFANLVVDEFFTENKDEPITFINTIKKDFQNYPFEYTTCKDIDSEADFKVFLQEAQSQFENIKRVLNYDFEINDISVENATLEPSFLCELYGIQGRLDILEISENGKHPKIVELKSGGVPFPYHSKTIKPNHATQLFLYYQLIARLEGIEYNNISTGIHGYILYSKIAQDNLRLGSDFLYLKRIQEIFNLRNKIISNEYLLTLDDLSITRNIISKVTPDNLINGEKVSSKFRLNYLEPQINEAMDPIKKMRDLEQLYFYSFISFIAKEQYIAKIGDSGNPYQQNNGLANLWLNSFDEKKDRFEILYDLEIEENLIAQEEKEITFTRINKENEFVNFRKGDICILYPRDKDEDNATTNQIFKCSIKELTKDSVVVQFRYQQRNTLYFQKFKKWALERDFMDSSFRAMYKNLYTFISSKEEFKRDLILATKPPLEGSTVNYHNKSLSEEQNRIIKKALSAKNYFILNGPPGTGKTSIIIKELVRELYKNEDKSILLLAYTNKAVDEICDTVNNAIINFDDVNRGFVNFGRTDRNFIRIGNELSCAQEHKHNLLSNVSKGISTRDELKALLQKHRVYVSTVSSLASKMDIFKLKHFDTVIVDEASQILEPQIVGILTKFRRFILIGDHKQLPAIVLQNSESSRTKNKELEAIGLENRKNSLFERLYVYCEKNNLDFAYDILTYQGRMHQEIALFPSHTFYESKLKQAYDIPTLSPEKKKSLERQVVPLRFIPKTKNTLEDLLCKKRMIFFSSKGDQKDILFDKKNNCEAELVVKVIQEIKNIYGDDFVESETVGVIAPFRNQIALIKQKLEEAEIPNYDDITVDTVERFQGSQRDIIILSFAVNNPYQLNSVINTNDDGTVDRKLNVALTRAKEQLILIGNDSILSQNLNYYKLIEFVKSKNAYVYNTIQEVLEGELNFRYFDSDESIEGTTYTPDNEFYNTFHNLVINVLKNDKRTLNYPNQILGKSKDYIRNNIIEYGRADFDALNLLDPELSLVDKVNLYCFYNMRKHYFSGYSIFESYSEFFNQEMKLTSGRLSFFDFGCGPLTSGLAFNQLFKHISPFKLKYFGIDISSSMLSKAKEFSETSLFKSNTQFQFVKSIKEVSDDILEENFRLSNTVILNFSYLFSNLTNEQSIDLAKDINNLVFKYPLNKYIIIYQNPRHRHHNFTRFKNALNKINNSVVRKTETVAYKSHHQSWYDTTEVFTYEILTN